MKIGINLRSFRDAFKEGMTTGEALDQCVAWGAESVVIPWGTPGKAPPGTPSQDPAVLTALVADIRRRGLEVAAFWICNDFAFAGQGDWREKQISATKDLLRLSGELGIRDLQVWTGRYSEGFDRCHQEQLVESGFAACVPVAQASGVRLSIENHIDIHPQAADLVDLCERQGPALALCPNPALWGIRADKEAFFAGDAAVHAKVLAEVGKAGPRTTLVNLGIWNGPGPAPAPWGGHWRAVMDLLGKHLGTAGCCCLQTYGEGDLLAALPGAMAAAR